MRRKSYSSRLSKDAFVDWTFTIVVACVVAASLIIYGLEVSASANKGLNAQAPKSVHETPADIDTKRLQDVLDQFDVRASARTNVSQLYDGPGDPSM